MGNICFGEDREDFKVICTINYCGISYSPFQFYFVEHQGSLQVISKIFRELVKQYVKDFDETKFKWEMGKIEKNFKLGRYSNMFEKNVGIEKKKFIDRKDFQEMWHSAYKQHLQKKKEKPQEQKCQEQVLLYDFIMYHTLLRFAYGDQPFEELIKNNPSKFLEAISPFYEISFLNEKLKLEKFKAGMQTHIPDVLFIQEYSTVLLEHLKKAGIYNVTIDAQGDSLVALNNKYFQTNENCNQIVNELRGKHQWFKTSAVTVANNIIFCCVHLSSGQVKNAAQVKQLMEAIDILITYKDYHFVVAGDINSFIKIEKQGIDFYPKTEKQFTTLKMRTSSQAQFHKAEKTVEESKDKIISSYPLQKCKITFIDDQPANDKSFLPTDSHPHDHFLVQAQISLRKP